jgi:hypothetical protein
MILQHTSQNAIYQKNASREKIKFNFGESRIVLSGWKKYWRYDCMFVQDIGMHLV